MSLLRRFIRNQRELSRRFDNALPKHFRIDGNSDFQNDFAPKYLRPKQRIYDVGGGKNPFLSSNAKRNLDAYVIGLDIDAAELARAPTGSYEETIVADITSYSGRGDADIVVCQTLLEHVVDVPRAMGAIASLLKPDGIALIFVPSRNAAFARLNLLLPEKFKRWLLFSIFPESRQVQGFHSYYNNCTPKDFRRIATEHGLKVIDERFYYESAYFTFFVPLHILWRLWVLVFHAFASSQAAETFSIAIGLSDIGTRQRSRPHNL
jgi:2-polyprenyl-6-hydroxyphenyl methylase/3-demethylubiquinone-9 3-methyltransferase